MNKGLTEQIRSVLDGAGILSKVDKETADMVIDELSQLITPKQSDDDKKEYINSLIDKYMEKDGDWLRMTEVTRRHFVYDLMDVISVPSKKHSHGDVYYENGSCPYPDCMLKGKYE